MRIPTYIMAPDVIISRELGNRFYLTDECDDFDLCRSCYKRVNQAALKAIKGGS